MKYVLKSCTGYVGTEDLIEIEGDFESEEEALEAFGGSDEARLWAVETQGLEWWVDEAEEDEE